MVRNLVQLVIERVGMCSDYYLLFPATSPHLVRRPFVCGSLHMRSANLLLNACKTQNMQSPHTNPPVWLVYRSKCIETSHRLDLLEYAVLMQRSSLVAVWELWVGFGGSLVGGVQTANLRQCCRLACSHPVFPPSFYWQLLPNRPLIGTKLTWSLCYLSQQSRSGTDLVWCFGVCGGAATKWWPGASWWCANRGGNNAVTGLSLRQPFAKRTCNVLYFFASLIVTFSDAINLSNRTVKKNGLNEMDEID